MSDEIDHLTDRAAQEAEFARRAHAIKEAWKLAQPPAQECMDCGEPLAELRQVMRCIRCVECQTAFEHRTRFFGRQT